MSNIQTSNITFNDIRTLLNANGGAVTNNVSTAFTNGNINKWAKNKPTRLNIMFTDAWQNALGDCGLDWSAVKVSSVSALKALYDNGTTDWTYKAPRGGAGEPYRLGDFRGYNSAAEPIIRAVTASNPTYQGAKAHIEALNNLAGGDNVHLSDLTSLAAWCAGVVVYMGETYIGTATAASGVLGLSLDIDMNGYALGTYKIYPCLVKNAKAWGDAETANEYIALPIEATSFEYVSNGGGAVGSDYTITLSAVRKNGNITVDITISATGNVEFANVYVEGRFSTDYSILQNGETSQNIGTLTVGASGYTAQVVIANAAEGIKVVRLTCAGKNIDMHTVVFDDSGSEL